MPTISKIQRDLRRSGYIVSKTKGDHFKVTHPTKPGMVFMAGTPGDVRAEKNARSMLHRVFGKTQE